MTLFLWRVCSLETQPVGMSWDLVCSHGVEVDFFGSILLLPASINPTLSDGLARSARQFAVASDSGLRMGDSPQVISSLRP